MKAFYVFLGIAVGIIIGLGFGPQISEALYSIPPTEAFKSVSIANNVTYTPSFETNVTAINYRDNYWLVTDGSILLNITTYP